MRTEQLVVIAAVLGLGASGAAADPAADLAKRGIELFKAGKYADAVATLEKAYGLDPRPETLFALAQAERLGGDCKSAVEHYHQVLEKVSDLNVGKLVAQALTMCPSEAPPPAPVAAPVEPPPKPAPAPPPQIITKTVVREVPHTDKLAATAAALGALSLGAAVGLDIAALDNHTAAEHAYTVADQTTFEHRSDLEREAALVAAGSGIVLIGVATWKWLRGGHGGAPTGADVVVITPTASGTGGALSVIGRW